MSTDNTNASCAPVGAGSKSQRIIRRILIANRGEIAIRVMRTARRMGIHCIAVYSTADAQAEHVRFADEAHCIGDPAPSASYLNIARILEVAKEAQADAIHPGYGFLAENETFAAAVEDAGIVFVGPTAAAIEAMGDKARAKVRVEQAGLPTIPGYQGEDQSVDRLMQEARRVGFPIMIKASAGGGGRGMRRVESEAEFAAALSSAQNEAQGAFGDSRVILERALTRPRHVEIQVLADAHGNCIHLGERDCSIQRRHQKVVEESPSPAVNDALRARMGETAVAIAKLIHYRNAGTLEFLLDESGEFYFMEMNTRLQVEHPVTEMVTGLDLVEQQLRVAQGATLSIRQADVQFKGHAIEVRLCAEDAVGGFLPQTGRVQHWQASTHARTDHALKDGAVVSPWYDSMLAKIIVHADTREAACRKLQQALDDTVLTGLISNLPFLRQVSSHPAFVAGATSTAFIDTHFADAKTRSPAISRRDLALMAVHVATRSDTAGHAFPAELQGFISSAFFARSVRLTVGNGAAQTTAVLEVRADTSGLQVSHVVNFVDVNGVNLCCDPSLQGPFETTDPNVAGAEIQRPSDTGALRISHAELQTNAHRIRTVAANQLLLATVNGVIEVNDISRASRIKIDPDAFVADIKSPMNGRVVAVKVEAGQDIAAKSVCVLVEAMKMEHSITVPAASKVSEVLVKPGDQVSPGQILVKLEPHQQQESPHGAA